MAFLVSRILGNEMEVFAAYDKGAVHFGRHNCAREDTTSDRNLACKRAFFVY